MQSIYKGLYNLHTVIFYSVPINGASLRKRRNHARTSGIKKAVIGMTAFLSFNRRIKCSYLESMPKVLARFSPIDGIKWLIQRYRLALA